MPEETPKACVPSRLPSLPHALGTSQFLQHHSAGCCHHRRGDPEEGSWRRAPRGPSPRSSSRAATSFGCSRCSFSAGGPAWIWRLRAWAEGSRPPGPRGRAHWLAPPPHPPQPQQSTHGPRLLRPQARGGSPGHQGLKGTVSTLFLYLVFCIGVDVTYSVVECVCFFVSGVQQHGSLMHTVYMFFSGFSSHTVYDALLSMVPCPTVGSC